MTSIEIAIIVAIVLVIAVAVGWYLYTTFVASAATHGRLSISSAEFFSGDKRLRLYITNPGPQTVEIKYAVLNGTTCTLDANTQTQIGVGATVEVKATCNNIGTARSGIMLSGYIVTTDGSSFPFTAVVRGASLGS